MTINYNAPVSCNAEIFIPFPIEIVWDVQTNISEWSSWNKDVNHVKVNEPISIGSSFRWKAKGLKIISTIKEIDPQTKLTWTGRMLGIRAIHSWTFEKKEGGVLVRTEESFEGFIVKITPYFFRKMLQKSLQSSLDALYDECNRVYNLRQSLLF